MVEGLFFFLILGLILVVYSLFRIRILLLIKEVKQKGRELQLRPSSQGMNQTKGRFGLTSYAHYHNFQHYLFVTETNPYGIVKSLNSGRVTNSEATRLASDLYRIRFLQKKGKTFLVIMDDTN